MTTIYKPRHVISINVAFWRVESDEPMQPSFNFRNSKWCSVSSLRVKRLPKALIRLCICAGWSEPLLVAHTKLLEISCCGSLYFLVVGLGTSNSMLFLLYIQLVMATSCQALCYLFFFLLFTDHIMYSWLWWRRTRHVCREDNCSVFCCTWDLLLCFTCGKLEKKHVYSPPAPPPP